MTGKIFKVIKNRNGSQQPGFVGAFDYLSFIKKTTQRPYKGGSIEVSTAQVTMMQLLRSDMVLQIGDEWFSIINHDESMAGIFKYYLKETAGLNANG